MPASAHHHRVLQFAEAQYKLAIAVRAAVSAANDTLFQYLGAFSYGKHVLGQDDLKLNHDEEDEAAWALVHCSTYILAVQMDTVLGEVLQDRFNHPNAAFESCAWICRLLRNAFSHNPFVPTWETRPECDNRRFAVPGIIQLDTSGLNGQRVERMHYGGPLALLRLSQFVRSSVLGPVA